MCPSHFAAHHGRKQRADVKIYEQCLPNSALECCLEQFADSKQARWRRTTPLQVIHPNQLQGNALGECCDEHRSLQPIHRSVGLRSSVYSNCSKFLYPASSESNGSCNLEYSKLRCVCDVPPNFPQEPGSQAVAESSDKQQSLSKTMKHMGLESQCEERPSLLTLHASANCSNMSHCGPASREQENPATPGRKSVRNIVSVRRVRLFVGPESTGQQSVAPKLMLRASASGGIDRQGSKASTALDPSHFENDAIVRPLNRLIPLPSPRDIDSMIKAASHGQVQLSSVFKQNVRISRPLPRGIPSAVNSSPFSLTGLHPPPAVPTLLAETATCGSPSAPAQSIALNIQDQKVTVLTLVSPRKEEFAPEEWKQFSGARTLESSQLMPSSVASSMAAETFYTYSPHKSEKGAFSPASAMTRNSQMTGSLFPRQSQGMQAPAAHASWPEDMSAPDSPRAGDAASHYSFYRASVDAHIDELQLAHRSRELLSRSRDGEVPVDSIPVPTNHSIATSGSHSQAVSARHMNIDVSVSRARLDIEHAEKVQMRPAFDVAGLDAATARLQRLLMRVRTLGIKLPRKVGGPLKTQLVLASKCLKVAKAAPATPASVAEVDECIDGVLLAVIAAEKYMTNRSSSRSGSSASSVASWSAETSLSAELNTSSVTTAARLQLEPSMPTVREAEVETPSNRRQHVSPSLSPPRARTPPGSQAPSCMSFNAPSPSFTAGGVSATWEGVPTDQVQLADPAPSKWLKRSASARSKSETSEVSTITPDSSVAGSATSGRRHRRHHHRLPSAKTGGSAKSTRQRSGYVYSFENKTMRRTHTQHEIMRRTNLAKLTQDVFLSPKVNIKTGRRPAFTF